MPTMKRIVRRVRAARAYPTPITKPPRLTGLVARVHAHGGKKPKSR